MLKIEPINKTSLVVTLREEFNPPEHFGGAQLTNPVQDEQLRGRHWVIGPIPQTVSNKSHEEFRQFARNDQITSLYKDTFGASGKRNSCPQGQFGCKLDRNLMESELITPTSDSGHYHNLKGFHRFTISAICG